MAITDQILNFLNRRIPNNQNLFTLWINPSSITELLNFLNSSYNASTSFIVTASLTNNHKQPFKTHIAHSNNLFKTKNCLMRLSHKTVSQKIFSFKTLTIRDIRWSKSINSKLLFFFLDIVGRNLFWPVTFTCSIYDWLSYLNTWYDY